MSEADLSTDELFELAKSGDQHALGELFQTYYNRLLTIIRFRMDSRVRGRIDPTDVLQDTFLEATHRFADYAKSPEMPVFLWLRFLAVQKLLQMHRMHLGAQARDAAREISIFAGPQPQATSAVLAAHLLGRLTSPSAAFTRAETKLKVERALNAMDEMDREVLALRHFEQLGNIEVARLLGISKTAASNRYVRAVKRMQKIIEQIQAPAD